MPHASGASRDATGWDAALADLRAPARCATKPDKLK